jgi:hypothetical protein
VVLTRKAGYALNCLEAGHHVSDQSSKSQDEVTTPPRNQRKRFDIRMSSRNTLPTTISSSLLALPGSEWRHPLLNIFARYSTSRVTQTICLELRCVIRKKQRGVTAANTHSICQTKSWACTFESSSSCVGIGWVQWIVAGLLTLTPSQDTHPQAADLRIWSCEDIRVLPGRSSMGEENRENGVLYLPTLRLSCGLR